MGTSIVTMRHSGEAQLAEVKDLRFGRRLSVKCAHGKLRVNVIKFCSSCSLEGTVEKPASSKYYGK